VAYVSAAPEMMTAAATDLATAGSDLGAAHMAAAIPTVGLVPAAADEVSAGIAHLFSEHAQGYHALAAQAAAFQDQFVGNLKASAASYTSIEDAIVSFLKGLAADARQVTSTLGLTQQVEQLQTLLLFAFFTIVFQFTPLGPFYDVAFLVFLAEQLLKGFGL
jgi:PE family